MAFVLLGLAIALIVAGLAFVYWPAALIAAGLMIGAVALYEIFGPDGDAT